MKLRIKIPELLCPELCCNCHDAPSESVFLCRLCLSLLPTQLRTVKSTGIVSNIFALAPYEGPGGAVIRKFKYQSNLWLGHQLGRRLAEAATKLDKPELIIPIPSISRHMRGRGFNPAYVLAKQVSKVLNIPCRDDILLRVDPEAQAGRPLHQRRDNLLSRFELKGIPPSSKILLVDDVHTTGGTIDAAGITLLNYSCQVSAIAFASQKL
jgi:ComF family protein